MLIDEVVYCQCMLGRESSATSLAPVPMFSNIEQRGVEPLV